MKLIHFADVHLGMVNYGHLDVATGLHTRILDFLDSMDCLVDAVQSIEPDLVLFAGDAFKTRTPNPTLVNLFADRIRSMAEVAPVICVVGNHDRQGGGTGKSHSIDVLAKLETGNPVIVESEIACIDTDCAHIVTLPWLYVEDTNGLESIVDTLDATCRAISSDHAPVVLLGHADVESAKYSSSYTVFLGDTPHVYPTELFEGFDYVAMGHIHKHQLVGNVVYSGSLDRIDWGERDDPKGFVVVDINDTVHWKFVATQARPMIDLLVSYEDLTALKDEDVEDAIVRVEVCGVPRKASEGKIRRYVAEWMSHAFLLDSITVTKDEVISRRRDNLSSIANMSQIELLAKYFAERHKDPEYVEVLLDAALDIIEEVEDAEIS